MLQLFLFCGFGFGPKESLQNKKKTKHKENKRKKEVKVNISHVQRNIFMIFERIIKPLKHHQKINMYKNIQEK